MFRSVCASSLRKIAEARALYDEAWGVYPDTPQFTRERGTAFALRAELEWVRGDADAARRNALAARPLVALVKDSRVAAVRLRQIFAAPRPHCHRIRPAADRGPRLSGGDVRRRAPHRPRHDEPGGPG